MAELPNSVEARDSAYQLHSFVDAREHEARGSMVIERGDGIHVIDSNGKRYIEAMSGLWNVALGFSEKRLAQAAARQMDILPYYHTFSAKSHGPSIDLAEKLIEIAPVPMSKVYFTNSGSEANDTAIKLIWYRANAMGQPQRKKIISRVNAYHGVTLATGSLTGLAVCHTSFDLPMQGVLHTHCPHYRTMKIENETEAQFVQRCADDLEAMIQAEGPDTIAAFFAEPVMGASGVIVPPDGYWAAIQPVLKRHGILFVADEVICGFGRTGTMFGTTTFGLEPDMITMSKQLSSSYLPISALLMNDKVFAPIADESHRIGTFAHGFTAAGHPTAAAVALENIKIIEERNLVGHVQDIAPLFQKRLRQLAENPLAIEARGIGLIGAVEFTGAKLANPGDLGRRLHADMQQAGLITRFIGDSIAFCPPLITTAAQVNEIFDIAERASTALAAKL